MIEGDPESDLHHLKYDSPTLFQLISRMYADNSSNVDLLLAAYKIACNAGAKNERGFKRKQGTSFNPRPARCATIAIKYADESEAVLIAATMLGCAEIAQARALAGQFPEMKRPLDLASLASRQIDYPPTGEAADEIELDSLSVALSISLDNIRHIHLNTENSVEMKKSFLHRCERLLELARQHPQPDGPGTLLSIYSQAITRQTARL